MKFLTSEEYKEYKNVHLQDLWKATCPFCNKEANAERIIWNGKHFYIMHALCSYAGVKNHLLVIPHDHKKHTHEMSAEEFSGLREVEEFMRNYYGNEEYFSFIRESMGNRSLEHLHYHFLPGVVKETQMSEILRSQGYPKD